MQQLTAEVDHVAVAVPDLDIADKRWRDELGGRWIAWHHREGQFRSRQLRYRNLAKIELLMPDGEDGGNVVRRFLEEHGSLVHHVTLTVPDLDEATALLTGAGLDVVDRAEFGEAWQEAFLRPSQIGGIVVQVAHSERSDEEWARQVGHDPQTPPPDGAQLRGPLLRHPDLDRARRIWTLLGAQVTHDAGGLTCRWSRSPLTVRVVPGSTAGTMGLRFSDAPPLPPDPDLGAAVIPAEE